MAYSKIQNLVVELFHMKVFQQLLIILNALSKGIWNRQAGVGGEGTETLLASFPD